MIPKELARKVRHIQFHTSKAVNNLLAGEYKSVFKGRGMELDEVREYQPGDEIRTIDWNITARMGKPFVKRFREERELTVILLVDLSASGNFGSMGRLKNELATNICALLAFAVIRNNDNVGLIAFTDQIEMFIPPRRGTRHVLRIIREILSFQPAQAKTDVVCALDYLGRIIRKRSIVFLLSDFEAEGFVRPLRVLSKHHDIIAVVIRDPREMQLTDVGLIEFEDAETGEIALVDTGNLGVCRQYEELGTESALRLRELFRSTGVDYVEMQTDRDYARDLVRFFNARQKRKR
jgi:uncharacterized protein (DUF58 family)